MKFLHKKFLFFAIVSTLSSALAFGNTFIPTNVGHAQLQGRRPTMEDAYCTFIKPDHAFFGLFDGHGGSVVSQALGDGLLYNNFLNIFTDYSPSCQAYLERFIQPNDALELAFLATQAKFDRMLAAAYQGSTAVCAFFFANELYIANVGDSRAVLSVNGKARALSEDHKPNRPDEKERIEALGGKVIFNGTWRVQGQLAISRALGDCTLHPYVIATPEITSVSLLDKNNEFLILACDGVWDILSNQQAVDIVTTELKKNNSSQKAAQALVQKAYDAGSTDNISALVIVLP